MGSLDARGSAGGVPDFEFLEVEIGSIDRGFA